MYKSVRQKYKGLQTWSSSGAVKQQQQDGVEGRKSTAKLNEILAIERQVQERWEAEKVFQEDAPQPGTSAAK